jgi:hypothetical protein
VRILRLLPVAAVVLAVVATGTSAAAAPARPHTAPPLSVAPAAHLARPATPGGLRNPNQSSSNWSGYVDAGLAGQFTAVTSSWTQPAVPCNVAGAASFWVGFDGWANGTVEQTGTAVDCRSGSPHYYGWYEMYPAGSVNYGDTLRPGDNMSATVSRSGSTYTLTLQDFTEFWTETHTVAGSGVNASAEVIAEAPSAGGILPLPDFGFTGFRGSAVNGAAMTGANAFGVDMADPSGGTTTAGAIDNSGDFSVTTGNGGDVTGSPMIAFPSANYGGSPWSLTPNGAGYLGQNIRSGTSPSVTRLAGGGYEGAFQASSGLLMVWGTALTFNTQLGMAAGTSPAIAPSPGGGFQVMFQADTGALYSFTPQTGGVPTGYTVKSGTSPSIAAVSGGFETAFQAPNGHLTEIGVNNFDTQLGMAANTSPSITAMPGTTFKVAFQANTGVLWTQDLAVGGVPTGAAMAAGTSPALTSLSGGGFEIAVHGTNGHLWEYGTYIANFDTVLGMWPGTSPSITPMPDVVFDVAFQADTGALWMQNLAVGGRYQGQYMPAGSRPSITG